MQAVSVAFSTLHCYEYIADFSYIAGSLDPGNFLVVVLVSLQLSFFSRQFGVYTQCVCSENVFTSLLFSQLTRLPCCSTWFSVGNGQLKVVLGCGNVDVVKQMCFNIGTRRKDI